MNQPVHIQYFAVLREQRGLSRETAATAARTVGALYAELRSRHGFTLGPEHLKVAVNGDFKPWDAPLAANDEVVFIPPMAGG